MKRIRHRACVLFAVFTASALAHRAPNSVVRLDFGATAVRVEVHGAALRARLRAAGCPRRARIHRLSVCATSPRRLPRERRGASEVRGVREASYLEHDYLLAELDLIPPPGASPQRFVLVDDAVTHEVRNHVVWVVSSQGDGLLGALQYPARRLVIERPPAPSPVAQR